MNASHVVEKNTYSAVGYSRHVYQVYFIDGIIQCFYSLADFWSPTYVTEK